MAHWAASAGVGSAFAAGMAASGIARMGANPALSGNVMWSGAPLTPPGCGVSKVEIKTDVCTCPPPPPRKIEIPPPPPFSLFSDPRYEDINKNLMAGARFDSKP